MTPQQILMNRGHSATQRGPPPAHMCSCTDLLNFNPAPMCPRRWAGRTGLMDGGGCWGEGNWKCDRGHLVGATDFFFSF